MEFICSDNIWKDAEYEDMFDAIYCAPALSGDMERDDVDLLLEMLRPGGRLVVPIENPVDGAQRLMIFDKDEAGPPSSPRRGRRSRVKCYLLVKKQKK